MIGLVFKVFLCHFISGLSLEDGKQWKPTCHQTVKSVNCDHRQEIGVFELILTLFLCLDKKQVLQKCPRC